MIEDLPLSFSYILALPICTSDFIQFFFQLVLPAGGRPVRAKRQEIWGCQWKGVDRRDNDEHHYTTFHQFY